MNTKTQTQSEILNFIWKHKTAFWSSLFTLCFLLFSTNLIYGQVSFGAYYTKLNTGQSWEAYSRTDKYADVVVQLSNPKGELVFWRGNSYLPYWKTDQGKWDLTEIVPRTGDGTTTMPDRVNLFSHAEIIENNSSEIIIHWRYLSNFTDGNPKGNVNRDNFVDEDFTIDPNGRITRVVRKGTEKYDDWMDTTNRTTQILQLSESGIKEISRTNPVHSIVEKQIQGNPVKGPNVEKPVVWFKFNSGVGNSIKESISGTDIPVPGDKTFWKKGVSGTALEFDGYHTAVSLPADKSPDLSSGGVFEDSLENSGDITLEGWFAIGAYPWNWVPIVQQGDNTGYFLGIDSHGYPGFMAKIDGWWHELTVPNKPPFNDSNHLKIFHWYNIAGVYNKKDGMMRLYIDGKEIAEKYAGTGGVETVNADIRVGKAGILIEPTQGTHDNLPSEYSFDGLIDEVRIYNVALSRKQIDESFKNYYPGKSIINSPDMDKRSFPHPSTNSQFSAEYTHLNYYETWDDMWRFGKYPDVVIGFDELPMKYVFWRGVSYIPMMVNEENQWFTNEFNETGFYKGAPGDCEPMSDKACWYSHARIIENTPARKVVEWRYLLSNPSHHWANFNSTTGWGDVADWLFYIYPDGAVTKRMRCYTSVLDKWIEWDEQIAVFGEGQTPGSVIEKEPVMILVDSTGKTTKYNWITTPPDPQYKGKFAQVINLTGKYDPYSIQRFTGGNVYSGEVTWYSVTPSWNHWPTAQINSSGRNASFPDRAAHSSISHYYWNYSDQVLQGNITYKQKNLMEGLSDKNPSSLAELANSWIKAPSVSNVSGGISNGYSEVQRAYQFKYNTDKLSFKIDASKESPIHNLCFVIKDWTSRTTSAKLMVNGKEQAEGPNFRQGVFIDTDGTFTKVIWVGMSATVPQNFEIMKD